MPVLVLFVFGLVLRLLFQAATPDGGGCWHIGFQGDAPVWQDLAGRHAHGIFDAEFVLPWRPPGMTWSMVLLWNGEGATVWPVRLLFTVLGAATPPLLWLLLRREVAAPIAWIAAVLCAAATNLLLLSSGVHVETPYLFLVLLSLFDQQRLANGAGAGTALRWGLLHGLLCLLRGEHVLVWLALLAVARFGGARWRVLLLAVVAGGLPIAAWQVHAARLVAQWNQGAPPLPASALRWNAEAVAALRALPSFQQVPVFRFVTETMAARGHDRVQAADLGVVREAFGVDPAPLRTPFVALQGGMDFWLANTPEADGAFSRAALDRPPPLAGGDERYAPGLRGRLPRGGAFTFSHPPHVDALVHGYRRGLAELAADPLAAARRIGGKLWHAVEGATGGVGGYALPIGLSGMRRPVDVVTAGGVWPAIWRGVVLCLAMAGIWRLRRVRVMWPLLAFAAVRLAVVGAFFGYARQGALCLPVVAIGVAAVVQVVIDRRPSRRWLLAGVLAMAALLLLEAIRTATVSVSVDDRAWLGSGGGEAEYLRHRITFH